MITVLNNGKLADGLPIVVRMSTSLSEFPGLAKILHSFAELLEKGWNIENLLPFQESDHVIWVSTETEIIGATVFSFHPNMNHLWVSFSFTDPQYRKRGVNRTIYRYIEIQARARKLKYVGSMVHADNEERMASYEKLGFSKAMIRMHKAL